MEIGALRWTWGGVLVALGGLPLGCGPSVAATSGGAAGTSSDDGTAASTETSAAASGATSPVGDASTTTGSLDGSSGGVVPVPCDDPEPILQRNVEGEVPTGWERCASGVIRRVMAVGCEDPMPRGDSCSVPGSPCMVDADCTEQPYGRCQDPQSFSPCSCVYGCATDDDCAEGELCACGGTLRGGFEGAYPQGSTCVPADCIDDGDCGDGLCAIGARFSCAWFDHLAACLMPADACHTNDDCEDGTCYPQDDWSWACEGPGPICAPPPS